MKRSLAEWANVAEIVGAFAIVVSLVFVGVQIRDNTRATQNATFQQNVGYEIGIFEALSALDQGTLNRYGAYIEGEATAPLPAAGDPAWWLFMAAIRLWEDLYLQRQSGALAEWAWDSREPTIRIFVTGPGVTRVLEQEVLTDQFADWIRTVRRDAGLESP
jgi:hypothetical protein